MVIVSFLFVLRVDIEGDKHPKNNPKTCRYREIDSRKEDL
jgi:hypothetical protein